MSLCPANMERIAGKENGLRCHSDEVAEEKVGSTFLESIFLP